jgi:hypothetical protein
MTKVEMSKWLPNLVSCFGSLVNNTGDIFSKMADAFIFNCACSCTYIGFACINYRDESYNIFFKTCVCKYKGGKREKIYWENVRW